MKKQNAQDAAGCILSKHNHIKMNETVNGILYVTIQVEVNRYESTDPLDVQHLVDGHIQQVINSINKNPFLEASVAEYEVNELSVYDVDWENQLD